MRLVRRARKVSEKRTTLVRTLEGLPPEALTWRVEEGSWSLLDIVEHLVLAEQDVLIDLDGLAALPARRRTLRNRVGYWLVVGILRFRVPVQVPSEGMKPEGGRTLRELGATWALQHDRLIAFLESLKPGEERAAIFRHPVTGPMSVSDAIRMLEVHVDRHLGQAERALEAWAAATRE
ncbi:MAG: DinB family protein [Gemmatimonadota bacterium]